MTTKTLQKKLSRLEEKVALLEKRILPWPETKKVDAREALKLIHGMWAKHPRTPADVRRMRQRLWGSR